MYSIHIYMFLIHYQIPPYRSFIHKPYIPCVFVENENEIQVTNTSETNTLQLLQIATNPLCVFIFLSLYSLWLGGFTKYQVYDFLQKQKREKN